MAGWSLLSEYFALTLIVVIMMFFYDKRKLRSIRRQLYWVCLWLSVASILLNIASVSVIKNIHRFSVGLAMLLNSAYLMVSALLCAVITFYLFRQVLEYVYDKRCLRRAVVGLTVVTSVYLLLVLWNLGSGVLFYFDQAGNYCRGPLNLVGFAVPIVELVMLLMCYVRNRKSVSRAMVRIMWSVPVVVVLLVAYQLVYPDQLLNGAISALTDLIIFVSFQSSRIERDSLTGMYNRKSCLDELKLRTVGRQEYQIILVALTQFSRVNQVHGHSGGDAILVQIASFLRGLDDEGRVFRFNSVEFAVLLPRQEEAQLEAVCDRFREDWLLGEERVSVPACVAELTYRGQDWTPEQIIGYLEYAIRLGKEENRELVRFDGETAQRYQRREYLIRTLQRAIQEDGFQVWYQPVYHRDTGKFDSAEALLRLSDGQGGLISPGEFIPLAEETGMINALTWIVLEDVCRFLGSGAVPELKAVSVNLSMQQFLQKDLGQRIEETLERYGVAPERLKLEITERVLLDNTDYVRESMAELRCRKLNFYLDDFGTGYSNFSSVLDLPFETIKLDRSLMVGLTDNPRARMMADTIIPFFHELGEQVVAEGIESRQQAELALHCGADRIQGFYYAKPMPETDLVEWYLARREEK